MRLTINTMRALIPVTQKYHRLCILALPPGLWLFAAANIELDAEVGFEPLYIRPLAYEASEHSELLYSAVEIPRIELVW